MSEFVFLLQDVDYFAKTCTTVK